MNADRGVVVAQVAPEHYLFQSLETAAHNAAKVVSVGNMQSCCFFQSHDDLDAWTSTEPEPDFTQENAERF
jgi:hypothetical protein